MSEKLNKKGLERLWDKILLLADYIQGKISALEKSMPEQAKNGKLTIQKNGTEVQTFSANQGTDATANILVPTISNSAAVTQTGQMALDATEKNASIEGTLAHQIAQVNGSLADNFSKDVTYASGFATNLCNFRRSGNRVYYSGFVYSASAVISNGGVFATIPQNYFPVENTIGIGSYATTRYGAHNPTNVTIRTDGTLVFTSPVTATAQEISFVGSYQLA